MKEPATQPPLELWGGVECTFNRVGDQYFDQLERSHFRPAVWPGRPLAEAWERYKIPLAVTEAPLGCTREEQLRWFLKVWDDAGAVRQQGVEVLAVTAWSLLGSAIK